MILLRTSQVGDIAGAALADLQPERSDRGIEIADPGREHASPLLEKVDHGPEKSDHWDEIVDPDGEQVEQLTEN